jgi:hypothetical protein
MPNISVFFLWSSEKYREYHVLKIRFHTRLLKPRAYGLWLNSANSCEIFHFQLLIYNIVLLHSHLLKYSLVPRSYFKPVRAIKDNFLHILNNYLLISYCSESSFILFEIILFLLHDAEFIFCCIHILLRLLI